MKRWFLPLKIALVVLALLLGLRIVAPYLLKQQINQAINDLPGYSGSVSDVELLLLQGGMALDDISIYKKSISTKTPLFAAQRFETHILWRSLLSGEIIARALLVAPALEMIATSDADAKKEAKHGKQDAKKAQSATAKPGTPTGDLVDSVPIRIDHFEIRDGSLRFRKMDAKPAVDLHMKNIHLVMENLTNSEKVSESLIARLEMTGKAQDSGDFSLHLRINPLSQPIDFDLRSKLMHLNAKSLNSFTNEYGKFDFEKGSIDLITEVKVRKGYMDGYVKPLLHDIEIAGSADKNRDNDNVFRRAWEAIVGAAEDIVENKKEIQSGTVIPFKGPVEAPGTDLFAVVTTVLRNAYVRALIPEYGS